MNIRNVFALVKKDLLENSSNLFAPIAMTIALFFLMLVFVGAVMSFFNIIPVVLQFPSWASKFNVNDQIINPYIGFVAFLSIIILPIIGAKAFSQEKKLKTIELLLTYPFNEVELVLAKVISTFLIYFIFLFFALLYLVIFIFFYSFLNKGFIDFGNTWSGFLGLILLVLAIISLSVYISTLFNDVVPAWIVSLVIVLFLWIMGYMADLMPIKVKNILTTISLSSNFDNFSKGVIDLKNVVFFLVFSLLFIYLAITNLIDRK